MRTLRAQGARQEALDASQRLLALTPQDPYALRLGTLICLDVGWVDEAIGLARRAVERDPGNSANHLALSRAWAGSTRPEAVANQLAAAREAVLIDPNSTDAQVQIGAALAADGDVDAARAGLLRGVAARPGEHRCPEQPGRPGDAVRLGGGGRPPSGLGAGSEPPGGLCPAQPRCPGRPRGAQGRSVDAPGSLPRAGGGGGRPGPARPRPGGPGARVPPHGRVPLVAGPDRRPAPGAARPAAPDAGAHVVLADRGRAGGRCGHRHGGVPSRAR